MAACWHTPRRRRLLGRGGRPLPPDPSGGFHFGPSSPLCRRTVPSGWQGGAVEPIPLDAFEVLVADALASIPENLRAEMENVAIIVDDQSPPGPLFGLYEGIPLTKRGTYAGVTPDRITLFLATICRSARTPEDLARRVR